MPRIEALSLDKNLSLNPHVMYDYAAMTGPVLVTWEGISQKKLLVQRIKFAKFSSDWASEGS